MLAFSIINGLKFIGFTVSFFLVGMCGYTGMGIYDDKGFQYESSSPKGATAKILGSTIIILSLIAMFYLLHIGYESGFINEDSTGSDWDDYR